MELMNCAVIEDGRVINIAVADEATAEAFGWVVLPADSPVAIGWTTDGTTFAPPTPHED